MSAGHDGTRDGERKDEETTRTEGGRGGKEGQRELHDISCSNMEDFSRNEGTKQLVPNTIIWIGVESK